MGAHARQRPTTNARLGSADRLLREKKYSALSFGYSVLSLHGLPAGRSRWRTLRCISSSPRRQCVSTADHFEKPQRSPRREWKREVLKAISRSTLNAYSPRPKRLKKLFEAQAVHGIPGGHGSDQRRHLARLRRRPAGAEQALLGHGTSWPCPRRKRTHSRRGHCRRYPPTLSLIARRGLNDLEIEGSVSEGCCTTIGKVAIPEKNLEQGTGPLNPDEWTQ